jgi:methylated-DNA-[protein]-cysteine S-methyltransferase
MPNQLFFLDHVDSTPLGPIWVATSLSGLVAVSFGREEENFQHFFKHMTNVKIQNGNSLSGKILEQINRYLQGDLRVFSIPIDWTYLTDFCVKVLQATYEIPYGQIRTYGQIAHQINRPKAARAVGRAEATNPMPLVIPCHRVIGTDGKLHGYGAGNGLATKSWLLQLEGAL